MAERSSELQSIIGELYAVVAKLETKYPGRYFTPDGHMVGSLGEVVAAERYGLELFEASHPVHDAVAVDGKLVQIKATQGTKIALNECPDYLIVLHLSHDGDFEEIYNGPGASVWDVCGKMQKTGQRQITLTKLRKLQEEVDSKNRINTHTDFIKAVTAEEKPAYACRC